MDFLTSIVTYVLLLSLIFGENFGLNISEEDLHKERVQSVKDYTNQKDLREVWDNRQKTLRCCGVDSPKDWDTYAKIEVPLSCCADGNNCKDEPDNYFTQGCWTKTRKPKNSAVVVDKLHIVSLLTGGLLLLFITSFQV